LRPPFAGYGDFERYPTFAEKTGVLGYRLVRSHALVDGNKRVALLAMIEFVERNDYVFDDSDQDELGDVMEDAASGTMKQIEFIS
jgi:death on curing protein